MILHLFGFYNLVVVTLLLFKLSKRHCYSDQPIYTPIFKLFPYSAAVYPVTMTEADSQQTWYVNLPLHTS